MLLNNFRLGLQRAGVAASVARTARHACGHEHGHAHQHATAHATVNTGMHTALVTAARAYKIRTAVKKFCADCYIARRKGRVYVLCKSNPKHKQKQA